MRKEEGARACWDSEIVHKFCDLCIREIESGNRPSKHLTRDGWRNILKDFVHGTGRPYDKHQLQNKWIMLKEEWKRLKVSGEAKKYRRHEFEPELEKKLDKMFMVVGDLEEYAPVPSYSDDLDKPKTRKRRRKKSDDEIDSKIENTPLKTVEPSERGKSTEFKKTNSGEKNEDEEKDKPETQKRRRKKSDEQKDSKIESTPQKTDQSSERGKSTDFEITNLGEKSPKSAQNDQPKFPHLIANGNTETETAVVIKQCETIFSITEAIRLLDSLDEVAKASPLYYFAIKLILDKDKREVFMALLPEMKVWWLKMEESESRK